MKTIRYMFLAIAFSFMAAHASYAIQNDDTKKNVPVNTHVRSANNNTAIGGPAKKKGASIGGADVKTKPSPTPHP